MKLADVDDPYCFRSSVPPERYSNKAFSAIDPFALVSEDILALNSGIKDLLGSDNKKLETVAQYFFETSAGKKVRPAMVLLMSIAVNTHLSLNGFALDAPRNLSKTGALNSQLRLSEITEMIHTASLLHDDGEFCPSP